MTQPTNARLAAIAGAEPRVLDLLTRYRQTTAEARRRVGADGNLTAEGRTQALASAYATIRQQYGTELTGITNEVNANVTALQRAADTVRPTMATGVEGMLGRQAWWARSRSLLDAGIRVQDVVASATDPEQLWSLREELPSAARAGIVTFPADPDIINALIDRRLAEVTGPAAAQAFDDAVDALIALAGLTSLLNYAAAEVAGQANEGSGLASAAAGMVARQQALLRLRPILQDVPTSTDAS